MSIAFLKFFNITNTQMPCLSQTNIHSLSPFLLQLALTLSLSPWLQHALSLVLYISLTHTLSFSLLCSHNTAISIFLALHSFSFSSCLWHTVHTSLSTHTHSLTLYLTHSPMHTHTHIVYLFSHTHSFLSMTLDNGTIFWPENVSLFLTMAQRMNTLSAFD